MDRDVIEQYANGGQKLSMAVRGLTEQDLRTFPPPNSPADLGKWSIQQIIIHLLDSDLVASDRMKRIIAMDNPRLEGYDESKFVERLFYDDQPAEKAIQLFESNRQMTAIILRKLPAEAFARLGQHSERGPVTLESQVKLYIKHLDNHIGFIHRKRAAMGKEMW